MYMQKRTSEKRVSNVAALRITLTNIGYKIFIAEFADQARSA